MYFIYSNFERGAWDLLHVDHSCLPYKPNRVVEFHKYSNAAICCKLFEKHVKNVLFFSWLSEVKKPKLFPPFIYIPQVKQLDPINWQLWVEDKSLNYSMPDLG